MASPSSCALAAVCHYRGSIDAQDADPETLANWERSVKPGSREFKNTPAYVHRPVTLELTSPWGIQDGGAEEEDESLYA